MEHTIGQVKRVYVWRFDMGRDLLQELNAAVQRAGIHHGTIVAGIGSLVTYHVHVVGEKKRPIPNLYMQGAGGYDLVAMQGYIIAGRVHAHITIASEADTIGGHLEPGCEIYTFAIVTVAELESIALDDFDAVRWPDEAEDST